MKMRLDDIKHNFPQIPEEKMKVKVKHLNLKDEKEVKLFK
jgi:hypothetical protein